MSFETTLRVLSETLPLRTKLEALKGFVEGFEEMVVTEAFRHNGRHFITSLLKALRETVPQFVSENEIHQFRKLCLEIILRLSNTDPVRSFGREMVGWMLSIVQCDNDENAVLALRVVNDMMKSTSRQGYAQPLSSQEIMNFTAHIKHCFREFIRKCEHTNVVFQLQPPLLANGHLDEEVRRALPELYYSKCISPPSDPSTAQENNPTEQQTYTILPRSQLSVKVFGEITQFYLVMLQVYRGNVTAELMDMLPLFGSFVAIRVPQLPPEQLNVPFVDEFHSSQIRIINFLSFLGKSSVFGRQSPFFEANAPMIARSICQLLESLSPSAAASRRELLIGIKPFFQSEWNRHFIEVVPRLMNEHLLLGDANVNQDHLRNFLYSQVVDLLHHIRLCLPYQMLLQVVMLGYRCLHDRRLQIYVQIMYSKLLMNVCEPLVICEERGDGAAREGLLLTLSACVEKAEVLANFYVPTLITQFNAEALRKEQQQNSNAGPSPPKSVLEKAPSTSADTAETPVDESKSQTQITNTQSSIATTQPSAANNSNAQWFEPAPVSAGECRNLIRIIVQPVKIVALNLVKARQTDASSSAFSERDLFDRFFVATLRCFEIFKAIEAQLQPKSPQMMNLIKEGKEALDMFASIYAEASPSIFKYILSRRVEFVIDCIVAYPKLQDMVQIFFLSGSVSVIVGTVFLKHMIANMSVIIPNSERSLVFLRIFKSIFMAISNSFSPASGAQRTADHELMLLPYLHELVAQCIKMAQRARDPHPFFVLLRSLFRSIGTGSHDVLYQQFLPLLPSILQKLNRFQNGAARLPIHDVFVELCLTVPVRLSSLLPYLPLLMDPLVCAMHGSVSLVSQGIRTLELCVDNLQPDYFFDHMTPVRAALVQGLWRTVYTQQARDSTQQTNPAVSAIRILGKLGGSARRALIDAQIYAFIDHSDRVVGHSTLQAASYPVGTRQPPKLCISSTVETQQRADRPLSPSLSGTELTTPEKITKIGYPLSATLPLAQIVESALGIIRAISPNEHEYYIPQQINWAHWTTHAGGVSFGRLPRTQAFQLCEAVLLNAIAGSPLLSLGSNEETLREAFKQAYTKYSARQPLSSTPKLYQCSDSKSRAVVSSALLGLFYAVINNELRSQAMPLFRAIVGHLTKQAILESMLLSDIDEVARTTDTDEKLDTIAEILMSFRTANAENLDGALLIDVLCLAFSDSTKDLPSTALIALRFMDVIVKALFEPDALPTIYELPFFVRMVERFCELCYRREWYAKSGGSTALRFVLEHFPATFIRRRADLFLNALFTTIFGISDEIAQGTIDVAGKAVDQLMNVVFRSTADSPADRADFLQQSTLLPTIFGNLGSADFMIRMEMNRILEKLVELSGSTKAQLMEPHLLEMRRLLTDGFFAFPSASANSQLGIMDLFNRHGLDISVRDDEYIPKSQYFLLNIRTLVESTNVALHGMPSCRYSVTNLSGGSSSLDDQMTVIRRVAFESLRTHSRILLQKMQLPGAETGDSMETNQSEELKK